MWVVFASVKSTELVWFETGERIAWTTGTLREDSAATARWNTKNLDNNRKDKIRILLTRDKSYIRSICDPGRWQK